MTLQDADPSQTATTRRRIAATATAIAIAMALSAASPVQAGTLTIIHEFTGSPTGAPDGQLPQGGLTFDSAGDLLGTTSGGGTGLANDCGTVFMLTPPAGGPAIGVPWTESILHRFAATAVDGYYPSGGVTFDANGNLYGTTARIGPQGCTTPFAGTAGAVFSIKPPLGVGMPYRESVIHTFHGGDTHGDTPLANVVFDGLGNLYGTTSGGTYASGGVFKLTPPPGLIGHWGFNQIANFRTGPVDANSVTSGPLLDPSGHLFGVINVGDTTPGATIFELAQTGLALHTKNYTYDIPTPPVFYVSDNVPVYTTLLRDAAGNLYGTNPNGGKYRKGSVYKLTPPAIPGVTGWKSQVIYSFEGAYTTGVLGGTDGAHPQGGVIMDASGNLYGTTLDGGGTNECCGTIYELSPNVGLSGIFYTQTILYHFTGPDGAQPNSGLVMDATGALFGTARWGNSNNSHGIAFMFK